MSDDEREEDVESVSLPKTPASSDRTPATAKTRTAVQESISKTTKESSNRVDSFMADFTEAMDQSEEEEEEEDQEEDDPPPTASSSSKKRPLVRPPSPEKKSKKKKR